SVYQQRRHGGKREQGGGLMLTLGFAYHYVALPAALLSFSAMSSLLVYGRLKHKQPSVTPVAG
ncbi:hypothetical protein MUT78_18855, partial [Salmonella enterica subsp. enterica serovar Agona]|nr:hypothetical protein [Salmonella enterica subsp. enterica serovar Agona]